VHDAPVARVQRGERVPVPFPGPDDHGFERRDGHPTDPDVRGPGPLTHGQKSNVTPWASGRSFDQFKVQVCRRM
jgi:hypothetical protein